MTESNESSNNQQQPTAVLKAEHQTILRVIGVLKGIVEFRGVGRQRWMMRHLDPDDLTCPNYEPIYESAVWTMYDGDEPLLDFNVTFPGRTPTYNPGNKYALGLAQMDASQNLWYTHANHRLVHPVRHLVHVSFLRRPTRPWAVAVPTSSPCPVQSARCVRWDISRQPPSGAGHSDSTSE